MKLTDFTTIVEDNVNDTTITADQHVIDAVNWLSNFFSIPTIATGTTTIGQAYLAAPTLCKAVRRLTIDGVEIEEAEVKNLSGVEDNELTRWYFDNGQIQLTTAPTAAAAYKVWYDKKFIVPTGAVDTDVPDNLQELVSVGATFRYYRKMVSVVISQREKFPDVNPDELKAIRDQWAEDYIDMIKEVKKTQ